jgi:hypothetical protein
MGDGLRHPAEQRLRFVWGDTGPKISNNAAHDAWPNGSGNCGKVLLLHGVINTLQLREKPGIAGVSAGKLKRYG